MSVELKLDVTQAYQRCGLTGFTPNAMQQEMYDLVSDTDAGSAVLLKAPTGTGKMEAVTVPSLARGRRLILIYPAVSLLEDQEMRIARMLEHLSAGNSTRVYALVVDTGADMYRRVWRNGHELPPQRRHLLHGDVVLTTLDKFLYRFFGFGEPKKGYIYPLRLRYGRQPIFCFDEAHCYDDIAFTNFVDLVRAIGFNADAPRDVVVMSATMPASYAKEFEGLLTTLDYMTPERASSLLKVRRWPGHAFDYRAVPNVAIVPEVLSAIRTYHRSGRRTIVTIERVSTAIELYKQLSAQQLPGVLLYHGHQPHKRRHATYAELKCRERECEGYLLVTTSAIEVGCDLDAHTLITQLCNPEQVAQRAGRSNRRGEIEDARIVVIGQRIEAFLRTVTDEVEAKYVALLMSMAATGRFDASQLIELPRARTLPDYRVRTMFTMLYEYVYEAERANKPLHDKGLVVTRSWEPTVTLTTGWDDTTYKLDDPLQVPISRCTAYKPDQLTPDCEVRIQFYDESAERNRLEPPKFGGWAYHQDIIVRVSPSAFDPVLGYTHVPKVFLDGGRRGYHHTVSYTPNPAPGTVVALDAEEELDDDAGDAADAAVAQQQPRTVYWRYLDRLPTIRKTGEDTADEGVTLPESEESTAEEDSEDE